MKKTKRNIIYLSVVLFITALIFCAFYISNNNSKDYILTITDIMWCETGEYDNIVREVKV